LWKQSSKRPRFAVDDDDDAASRSTKRDSESISPTFGEQSVRLWCAAQVEQLG
jgi:hypothetical protein